MLKTLPAWAKDAILRLAGLSLLAVFGVAIIWLDHSVNVPPHHQGSAAELAIGACAVASFSLGASLLVLGLHLFDRIEVSTPWLPRS